MSPPGLVTVFVPRANIEVVCAEESISPGESKYVSQVEVEVREPGTDGRGLALLVEKITGRFIALSPGSVTGLVRTRTRERAATPESKKQTAHVNGLRSARM